MSLINTVPTTVTIDTGTSAGQIFSVAFHPDGRHLFSGGTDEVVRRWDVETGLEVGEPMKMYGVVYAIAVSRDHRWILSGSSRTTSVWDAKRHSKTIEVDEFERGSTVEVDIHPDSSRFATGRYFTQSVIIYDITTGEQLLGPLGLGGRLVGVKFSPNGDQIAAASEVSIHIFNSHNGNQLASIHSTGVFWAPMTPFAWSSDGQRIFTTSRRRTLRSFSVSTGYQLIESQAIHNDHDVASISVATGNGKFISTFADTIISLWDASTFTQIGSTIENIEGIRSIAVSPDGSYLATGGRQGTITIHGLSSILPEPYGPSNAFSEKPDLEAPKDPHRQQRDEQLSTSSDKDKESPHSYCVGDLQYVPQDSPKPTCQALAGEEPMSSTHGGNDNILETKTKLPSSPPKPLLDFDRPPSPVSFNPPQGAGVLPPVPIHADPPPPFAETAYTGEPFRVSRPIRRTPCRIFRSWLQTITRRRRHTSDETNSPMGVNLSASVEGQRQKRKLSAKEAVRPNTDNPNGGQKPENEKEADTKQSAIRVYATQMGKTTISITFPSWLSCCRGCTSDGMH